jgi:hypothetical protein
VTAMMRRAASSNPSPKRLAGGGSSPWSIDDVTRVVRLTVIGLGSLTVAWYGSAETAQWSRQMLWLLLAIAGLVVAASGCVSWLIAGLHPIRVARLNAMRSIHHCLPESTSGQSRQLDLCERDQFVTGVGMTRVHDPLCLLVAGKPTGAINAEAATEQGLTPCGMCCP